MNRFIKSLFFFSGFASILYVALLLTWGSRFIPSTFKPNLKYPFYSTGYTYSRLQEAKETSDVDILFIGSSHAYRSFDPRIFERYGYKVFNMGSSAQTPAQTRVLVNRYLEKIRPKFIVFEVYIGVFANDGTESALDIIANDKNDINSYCMSIRSNNPKVYNTLLYKTLIDLMNIKTGTDTELKRKIDSYVKGGYVERKINDFEKSSLGKWKLKQTQISEFEKIISLLKSKGIKFILVNTPVTTCFFKSIPNNNEFDSIMNSSGEYYNFNYLMKLDDSLHFLDSHHLNQKGVELFNDSLISLLRRR